VTRDALPDRAAVVAMLAAFGDRTPEAVDEELGSLELTWLIDEVEQRYDIRLDLTEEELDRMRTVSDAVEVIRGVLTGTQLP
jgi:acyl carrier protein